MLASLSALNRVKDLIPSSSSPSPSPSPRFPFLALRFRPLLRPLLPFVVLVAPRLLPKESSWTEMRLGEWLVS